LKGVLIFLSILLVAFVPALLASPEGLLDVFSYHGNRGVQIESTMGSALLKLNAVQGIVYAHGSLEVVGGLAGVAATATAVVTLVLLFITFGIIWHEARCGRFRPSHFPRYAAAILLAFIVGSKVLSPQYLVWLLPLVPLALRGAWNIGVSAMYLLACGLTTQIIFSDFYHAGSTLEEELEALYSGASLVLDSHRYISLVGANNLYYGIDPLNVLLGRNLLLIILWLAMIMVPAQEEPSLTTQGQAAGEEPHGA